MPSRRTAALPVVTAGLALLSGCVVVPAGEPASAPARRAAGGSVAARPKFAEYITAPGQRIAPHEATAQAAAPPAPAAPVPEPPPVERTAVSAQPPAAERVSLAPPPADPPLVSAVRATLDNRPDLAVEHLHGFDKAHQELLIRLLPALAHARDVKLADPVDAAVLSSQVEAAAEAVARAVPLRVKKACFVESVKQYGVYYPMPPGHQYLPGGTAVLYVEVANAPSEPTPHPSGGDGFVTKLACGLQILDSAGQPAAGFDPGASRMLPVADYTRSQLRDVFLRLEFQVPRRPGAYTLAFDVRDPAAATGRAARTAVEFRVAGESPSPAAGGR